MGIGGFVVWTIHLWGTTFWPDRIEASYDMLCLGLAIHSGWLNGHEWPIVARENPVVSTPEGLLLLVGPLSLDGPLNYCSLKINDAPKKAMEFSARVFRDFPWIFGDGDFLSNSAGRWGHVFYPFVIRDFQRWVPPGSLGILYHRDPLRSDIL